MVSSAPSRSPKSRAHKERPKGLRINGLPQATASDRGAGNATLIIAEGCRALYCPDGASFTAEHQEIEALRLRLNTHRLACTAAKLCEFAWSPRRFEQLLGHPISMKKAPVRSRRYLEQLEDLIALVEQWGGEGSIDALTLGIDVVIDRLVVLSLWGEWIHTLRSRHADGAAEKAGIIDDVLQWIRANCKRPITLSELEQRSGYSQRSLRNAFQDRFGCAPNEWIRRERMESARRQLLDALPGESVSSIAEEHGYSHVSQFSRDFRGIFGQQPSQVMRRGRRPID